MKVVGLFVAAILLFLAFPLFFAGKGGVSSPPAEGLPWQIEALPDGNIRVLGLVPGVNTLDDARSRHGTDVRVALLVAPGESGSVEAYFETIAIGGLTGRLVLTLATSAAQREGMARRARKAEFMEGTTRKVGLSDEDLAQAGKAVIAAMAFIPSANLDEKIVLERFGMPAERIRIGEQIEHFLYPDKGLDLRLDAKGKEVLQYVAPREFSRLSEPLRKAALRRGE